MFKQALYLALVALVLGATHVQAQEFEWIRAAYWDQRYPGAWGGGGIAMRDALEGAGYEVLDAAVTLFSHANVSLPPALERFVRYVIVTPDLHRIHHSSWQPETDSNFSAVFPVWDIVFRTFRPESNRPQDEMELGLESPRGERTARVGWLLLSGLTDAMHDS